MATAIENCSVVIIDVSSEFQHSVTYVRFSREWHCSKLLTIFVLQAHCRFQVDYAKQLCKPLIPLRVGTGHEPGGWLGRILDSKVCLDFASEARFDRNISRLVSELGDRGKVVPSISASPESEHFFSKVLPTSQDPFVAVSAYCPASSAILPVPRKCALAMLNLPPFAVSRSSHCSAPDAIVYKETAAMTVEDVCTWLGSVRLGHCVPTFRERSVSGKALLMLHELLRTDGLLSFTEHVQSKLGITKLGHALDLGWELRSKFGSV